MKNTINSYTGVMSQDGIVAVANVDEQLNIHTGDVDEVSEVKFYSRNLMEIGFAKITHRGDHYSFSFSSDYHGRKLAVKFGFAPASC